jgi:hypothetical protein
VDLLNKEGGRQVTSSLTERALDRAIVSGHNVLYELLRRESALPGEWEYLSKFRIRETQPPPNDETIAQSLTSPVAGQGGGWPMAVKLAADVSMASEAGITTGGLYWAIASQQGIHSAK